VAQCTRSSFVPCVAQTVELPVDVMLLRVSEHARACVWDTAGQERFITIA
jgi:hypothetical protein